MSGHMEGASRIVDRSIGFGEYFTFIGHICRVDDMTIYIGQALATSKCIGADVGYRGGNDNGLQAAAILVFATYCVSICFGQNGRKVVVWILLKKKTTKI